MGVAVHDCGEAALQVPALGFGVYAVAPDEAERVVTDALAAGYRHIDTAAA